ncbi:MAG: porin family protein [Bacteroidales bacterium]
MKHTIKILTGLTLLLSANLSSAQVRVDTLNYEDTTIVMDAAEHLIIGMGNDIWMDAPDNGDIRAYNPSFVFSALYDVPLGNSRLSFASGLGLQSNNLYNGAFIRESDSITGKMQFTDIADSLDHSKYKLSTTYLEIPVEFRLRLGEDHQFTIAAGFKAGYVINSHTKYKGKPMTSSRAFTNNDKVKIKEHNIPALNDLRYTVTGRIAYKKWSLFAHYNLTPLFEEGKLVNSSGKAKDMYLITAGFLFTAF